MILIKQFIKKKKKKLPKLDFCSVKKLFRKYDLRKKFKKASMIIKFGILINKGIISMPVF